MSENTIQRLKKSGRIPLHASQETKSAQDHQSDNSTSSKSFYGIGNNSTMEYTKCSKNINIGETYKDKRHHKEAVTDPHKTFPT